MWVKVFGRVIFVLKLSIIFYSKARQSLLFSALRFLLNLMHFPFHGKRGKVFELLFSWKSRTQSRDLMLSMSIIIPRNERNISTKLSRVFPNFDKTSPNYVFIERTLVQKMTSCAQHVFCKRRTFVAILRTSGKQI